jgi:hypothetical protein
MIQFLSDIIDQLDLALDQLSVNDRNFDRFALMLIDNVAELTLHKYVQDRAYDNELWTKLNKPKYDHSEIQKALGQNFDNKIKFAYKTGLVNQTLCESVLYLHTFRNTTYHRGLRHEGILHSLTIFYFINVCKILSAYKPKFWSWSSADKISHRARKYLGNPKWGDQEKNFKFAFNRLEQVASEMDWYLVTDLSNDLNKTIEDIDSAINFLSSDLPDNPSRDEVIIHSQIRGITFSDEAKKFAKENGYNGKSIADYIKWIKSNYKWSIKTDPIPKWKKRLYSLQNEKDLDLALKKYCDFLGQTDSIRNMITESAIELDEYIQHQIDIARGK